MEQSALPTYKGFIPIDEKERNFYVHDPLELDPLSKTRVRIPLFKPILTDDSVFHPQKVFCCLGPKYDNAYIELDTVIARLLRDARKEDWDSYNENKKPRMTVYRHDGKPCHKVPSTIFEYPDGSDFDAWDRKQSAIWRNIVSASTEQASKVPNDHGYFIKPRDDISLWFSPAPSNLLTVDQLEHIFKDAFENEELGLHKHDVQFLTFEQAKHRKLVLVGSNPFHLYYMWMTSEDYRDMWKEDKIATLAHPWPKDKPALKAIDTKIDANVADRDCQEQIVHVSREKYQMAATLGEQPESEKFVMGGLSAAEVAKDLWGRKKVEGDNTDDLEWISRVHFCLGGLTSGVASKEDAKADPASYLAKSNIILGSKGCKAHMTRTENAIINSLEFEASSSSLSGAKSGLIWTRDNHEKGAQVTRIGTDGDRNVHHIPDWAGTKEYPWLSVELQYFTTMRYRSLGDITLCSFESFDPLSRYAPTLVEAKLDRYLAFHLKDHSNPVISYPSHAKSSSSPGAQDLATKKLWQDVKSGVDTIKVGDIVVSHPIIVDSLGGKQLSECPAEPPSTGFVVAGLIKLFGSPKVKAHLHKWHGPPPSHVTLGNEPLKVESAHIVDEKFHLSSVIESLEGTPFDKITFRNARFYHQNYPFDPSRSVGWYFDADLVVDEECKGLYELLTKALGVTKKTMPAMTVPVRAALGLVGEWKSPFDPHSFMLYGNFPGALPDAIAKPVRNLHLETIGVRLMAIRKLNFSPGPQSALTYGYGVYGGMRLDVSDSLFPLNLEYEMRESKGNVQIGATVSGDAWYKPFGVNGALRNVNFSADFPLKAPWKDFSFDVSAMFAYKSTYATFAGSYDPDKQNFILSSYFPDFTIQNLAELFEHYSGGDYIRVPDVNINIGAATIYLSSSKRLNATLHDFEIAGYTIKKAEVEFRHKSVVIRGKLDQQVINFDDVELRDPVLHITMESQCSPAGLKRTDPVIQGRIELDSRFSFTANAYLYPACEGSGVEWTVMATLPQDNSETLALSKIVPEVAGHSLDLALKDVVFVAASKDHPDIGQMISHYAPFQRGVQICAAIDEIPILNKVVRHNVCGLHLRAEWSRATGYNLKVVPHKYLSLDFGHGLETTSIQLAIQTRPVQLVLSSNLNVRVHSGPPLVFRFDLLANDTGAKVRGQTNGAWENPLGVSTNIKIGPKLELALDIDFAKYSEALLPSITGGLQVGNTPITVKLHYYRNTTKQYLTGECPKLCKADLVSFAKLVTKSAINDFPEELSDFSSANVHIRSQADVICGVLIPQGFSLRAAATFCDKQTDLVAGIRQQRISVTGTIQDLELGHLKVRGARKPDAVIKVDLSKVQQETGLSGNSLIYDLGTTVQAELNPAKKPKFGFHTILSHSYVYEFLLNADYLGAFPVKSLTDAEFALHGNLEQRSLDHMRVNIRSRFDLTKQRIDKALYADQKEIERLQGELAADLANANDRLATAQASYDDLEKELRKKVEDLEKKLKKDTERLQQELDAATKKYKDAVKEAQDEYDNAVNESKQSQANDANALDQARRKMEKTVKEREVVYEKALADFAYFFGSVEIDIQRAEQDLCRLRDDLQRVQNNIKKLSSCDKMRKATLECDERTIKDKINRAQAALDAARAKHAGVDFQAAQKLIISSQQNVVDARKTGQAEVDRLEKASQKHKCEAEKNIQEKEEARISAVDNRADIDKAGKALQDCKDAMDLKIKAAQTQLNKLNESSEWDAVVKARQDVDKQRQRQDDLKKDMQRTMQSEDANLEIQKLCQYVLNGEFKICSVHLKGNSKDIIDKNGTFAKPLAAEVECNVDGKSHKLAALTFHPGQVPEFLNSVYDKLWDHARNHTKGGPDVHGQH